MPATSACLSSQKHRPGLRLPGGAQGSRSLCGILKRMEGNRKNSAPRGILNTPVSTSEAARPLWASQSRTDPRASWGSGVGLESRLRLSPQQRDERQRGRPLLPGRSPQAGSQVGPGICLCPPPSTERTSGLHHCENARGSQTRQNPRVTSLPQGTGAQLETSAGWKAVGNIPACSEENTANQESDTQQNHLSKARVE